MFCTLRKKLCSRVQKGCQCEGMKETNIPFSTSSTRRNLLDLARESGRYASNYTVWSKGRLFFKLHNKTGHFSVLDREY